MKKILILIVFVTLLFVSCSKTVEIGDYVRENSELVFNSDTSSILGTTIYFDSYERIDNKLIFYDKNHKYAGEAFETETSAIGRNMHKKVEKWESFFVLFSALLFISCSRSVKVTVDVVSSSKYTYLYTIKSNIYKNDDDEFRKYIFNTYDDLFMNQDDDFTVKVMSNKNLFGVENHE